jgi:hypothetical protein
MLHIEVTALADGDPDEREERSCQLEFHHNKIYSVDVCMTLYYGL